MKKTSKKIIFISWARNVPRSKNFSKIIGAKDYYIEYYKSAPIFFVPLRYFLQSIKTLIVLIRFKPEIAIAMNPPFVCPLIVFLYSKIKKIDYIVDSGHTGAFVGLWKRFLPIQKFISRRAIVTFVTNNNIKNIINSKKINVLVLPDKLPDPPNILIEETEKSNCPKIGVIFTFASNEPVDAVLSASKSLPNIEFAITGDLKRARSYYFKTKSHNVKFAGYLRGDEYWEFLKCNDAIMVLTTTNFELPCAAYEAVSIGKPIIISNWPTIKNYFNKGAIYVDNSAEGIIRGIDEFYRVRDRLSIEVKELKNELNDDMANRIKKLKLYFKIQ